MRTSPGASLKLFTHCPEMPLVMTAFQLSEALVVLPVESLSPVIVPAWPGASFQFAARCTPAISVGAMLWAGRTAPTSPPMNGLPPTKSMLRRVVTALLPATPAPPAPVEVAVVPPAEPASCPPLGRPPVPAAPPLALPPEPVTRSPARPELPAGGSLPVPPSPAPVPAVPPAPVTKTMDPLSRREESPG